MTVGERIELKRKEMNMSMEALGELLGVGRSAVNKWEKGYVQRISRSNIMKMAQIFDCDPAWLGGYTDDVQIEKGILEKRDIRKEIEALPHDPEWIAQAINLYENIEKAQQANPKAREMIENLIKSYQSDS